MTWAGGIGAGKAVNLGAEYAETQIPDLTTVYFKELVGLLAGPAAVGVAWKLSQNPRHTRKADLIGLTGVELFIDRLFKLGEEVMAPAAAPRLRGPRAPPPGRKTVQHWPFATEQRLPFQSDISW